MALFGMDSSIRDVAVCQASHYGACIGGRGGGGQCECCRGIFHVRQPSGGNSGGGGEGHSIRVTPPPLPLVTLADHNSVMVPGEDSATLMKEVSPVVRSREKEGHVLQQLELHDVWVYVHGEAMEEAVKGYTHMAKQRRIGRVHVQPIVLPFVRSTYLVATPSDHAAVPAGGAHVPNVFLFPDRGLIR